MKRLKLLLMMSSLNPSLCVFSSLGLPGPPLDADVAVGNFGRFVGKSDERSRSDTLVESDGAGIENFRDGPAVDVDWNAVGGNDGCAGEGDGETDDFLRVVDVSDSFGVGIGLAEGGIGI